MAGLWCAARVGDRVARMRGRYALWRRDLCHGMASKARCAELYEFDNARHLSRDFRFSEDYSRAHIARP